MPRKQRMNLLRKKTSMISKFEDGFSAQYFTNRSVSFDNQQAFELIKKRILNTNDGVTLVNLSDSEKTIELEASIDSKLRGDSSDRFFEIISSNYMRGSRERKQCLVSFSITTNTCSQYIDSFCDKRKAASTTSSENMEERAIYGMKYHGERGTIFAEVLPQGNEGRKILTEKAKGQSQLLFIWNIKGVAGLLHKIGLICSRLVTIRISSSLKTILGLLIRFIEICALFGISFFSVTNLVKAPDAMVKVVLSTTVTLLPFVIGFIYKENSILKVIDRVCSKRPLILLINDSKVKWWMKNLIAFSPIDTVYIGPTRGKNSSLPVVIAPSNDATWSLTCLCQMLRDVSGLWWNTDWIESHMAEKDVAFPPLIPASKEDLSVESFLNATNTLHFDYRYIHMNDKTQALPYADHFIRKEKERGVYWATCRIYVDEAFPNSINHYYPLGNTLYVIEYIKDSREARQDILQFLKALKTWSKVNCTKFSTPILIRIIIIENDVETFRMARTAASLLSFKDDATTVFDLLGVMFSNIARKYNKNEIDLLVTILNKDNYSILRNVIPHSDSIGTNMQNSKALQLRQRRGIIELNEEERTYEFDV